MIRALGIFGFAGGFLFLSPSLREYLGGAALQGMAYLNDYSPYSYAAAGIAVLGTLFLLAFSHGPR